MNVIEAKRISSSNLLVFFICLGIFSVSSIMPSRMLSEISLVVLCLYMLGLFITRPRFILKYLVFIFAVVTNIAGCAIAEFSSVFLGEVRVFAGYVGSLPLLILSRWLFIIILIVYDTLFGVDDKQLAVNHYLSDNTVRLLDTVTGAMTVALIIALLMTIKRPSAISLGIDRFSYAQLYANNRYIGYLNSYMPYLITIPLLSTRYGKRWLGALSVLCYSIILVWTGTKFGNLFAILCVAIWIYYDKISILERGKLNKIVISVIASLSLIAVFAVFVSSKSSTTLNASEYIAQRAAQQGQLWWRIYDISGGAQHVSEFRNEIEAIGNGKSAVSQNVGSNYGIYKIMYLAAPQSLIDSKIALGSCYTEAGYAAMFYYFGPFGTILFSTIMGISIGVVVNALLHSSTKLRFIDSFLLVRMTVVLRGTLGMFFFDFIDLPSIATYLYFILRYITDNSHDSSAI